MKNIKPIIDKKEYSKRLEVILFRLLVDIIFKKITEILDIEKELKNSKEDLIVKALEDRQIEYVDGVFIGNFNSNISKVLKLLGATFNKTKKGFVLDRENMPMELKNAIAYSTALAISQKELILQALDNIKIPSLVDTLDVPLDKTLEDLGEQAQKTLKEQISIIPNIDEGLRKALKQEYVDNIELSIRNFTESETKKLRGLVEENLFRGLGDRNLIEVIQKSFNTTKNKAIFLAKQETSLLVAKYKKHQYQSVGITHYRWSTSQDSRVRPLHKALNGKVFSWDNPPIVNEKGDRKNPSEDYGCRCVAIPII